MRCRLLDASFFGWESQTSEEERKKRASVAMELVTVVSHKVRGES